MGIVYSDLKPSNIVLIRYENIKESELTIYKYCYKIKLIDLGSFTYLKDIDKYNIKAHKIYPFCLTKSFTK
jgi:serine/threonine protein kinase